MNRDASFAVATMLPAGTTVVRKRGSFETRTASTKSTESARRSRPDSGGSTGGPVNALTATSASRAAGTPKLKRVEAERREDLVVHQVAERLAGDLLDDRAEHEAPGQRVVGEPAPGAPARLLAATAAP